MSHRFGLGLLAAAVTSLSCAAAAHAAPVTVDLRIEGATRTLFQGPVTTDVAPFRFSDDATTYRCDGSAPAGTETTPQVTRGAVIATAAQQAGFGLTGSFSAQFGSPTFDTVAGEAVPYDAATGRFLAEYEDGVAAQVGSCGDAVTNGSRVVFAYGTGTEPVLRLTAQPAAACSPTSAYRVTDDATGAPVAGATVGSATSDASGLVTLPAGSAAQATKDGTIRSNSFPSAPVPPCLPGGPAPTTTTGTPPVTPAAPADTTPAVGRVTSLTTGQRFARGRGPRVLSGTASDDRGVTEVRIRLSRSGGAGCARFDGTRERFVRTRRCSVSLARTFRVSTTGAWEYQLPSRLGPGRYVLDVLARDGAGNRLKTTQLRRGTSRVVFTVASAAALGALAGVALLAAPVGAASAPAIRTTVVGLGGRVLQAPTTVVAGTTRVDVAGAGSCEAPEGTPLAALAGTRVPFGVTASSCSPGELYVRSIGGRAASGADGWVYKVGTRVPSVGAGDPAARPAAGQPLLWFWCDMGARGCQRTLAVSRAGSRFRATGYDDEGRGARIRRALVTARSIADGVTRRGRTDARGEVVLRGLDASEGIAVGAARSGLVPAVAG